MSQRNADILPPHANHPGWEANGCPARLTVTPSWGSEAKPGFACRVSGGHCQPRDKCDAWRVEWAAFVALHPEAA